jgi:hypothetical protein
MEKLHELFRRGYFRRRVPEDLDSHSVGFQIAGGCLRSVLLIILFLMLSLFALSMLGSLFMFNYY